MDTIIIALLVTITFILTALLFSSWRTLKYMKKANNLPDKEGYFELKYQLQLHTTVYVIVAGFVAFFGWDSKANIDSKIESSYQKYSKTDSLIGNLEYRQLEIEKRLLLIDPNNLQEKFEEAQIKLNGLTSQATKITQSLKDFKKIFISKPFKYNPNDF